MAGKVNVAIIGSGNIGTDLMFKLERSPLLQLRLMMGIDPQSRGLAMAGERGYRTFTQGIQALRDDPDAADIVFDATSARAHIRHAKALKEMGKIVVDLTPAAVGPYVVPVVNLDEHLSEKNVNLITCGGQAAIPIVHAVNRVSHVEYAEMVSTISSYSAGPGTRQNIDEFTRTSAKGLEIIGGASRGKAIIILNPAKPPILMRNTIYTVAKDGDEKAIRASVEDMVRSVQKYVPGYTLKVPPLFDKEKVTTMIEVTGAGDFLPKYSGNLDIMNAAAVAVGERFAAKILRERGM